MGRNGRGEKERKGGNRDRRGRVRRKGDILGMSEVEESDHSEAHEYLYTP